MISIANPIYDVVFKYLMDDERIARTILSALLKMDIVHVEMRPHEYSNTKRDTLSVFRIDFAATVRKEDGSEHLILIELQKTWLETETLRFRQYLGVHYQNPKNVVGEGHDRHALPLVAIYLLGHKVGDIEEPVIYVQHEALDYERRPVTKGIPDPFVDSLTHDSIIVQIPRLHGQINTRLDKVLSIFDQSLKSKDNQQVLNLNDSLYKDDADMEHIVHRLLMASADADVRQDMNVEDEYYSVIEKRDTEILMRDRKLAEQKVQLQQQSDQLQQQSDQLQQQSDQLQQQSDQLQQQSDQLQQQSDQLQQQNDQLQQQSKLLRKSIQMFLNSGMTYDAIARELGIDVEQVKAAML